MQSVQTAKTLDIETTILTNPKLNKNKQLSAGIISSKTNSAVYIETPELINPFGLSFFDGAKGSTEETKSWSIVLKAAGGKNGNQEDIDKFFKFLKDLDEKIIDYGLLHSQTLFKKKYDESQRAIVVDLLYNKGVKSSVGKDGTVYPDQIKLKVMKNENMLPDVNVFKNSATPLALSSWEDLQALVPKGTPIKAIIQPRVYFVNGKFGTNFRVLQIKLPNVERVGRPIGYSFSEAPASEASSDDVSVPQKEVTPSKAEVTPDSEEEEEEEESEEGSEVEVEED
jgi:hypothetical protein